MSRARQGVLWQLWLRGLGHHFVDTDSPPPTPFLLFLAFLKLQSTLLALYGTLHMAVEAEYGGERFRRKKPDAAAIMKQQRARIPREPSKRASLLLGMYVQPCWLIDR